MGREAESSLADFYFSDSDDPLVPPESFTRWTEEGAWAMSMYEPQMLGGVAPRMNISRAGVTSRVVNLSSYNYLGLAMHPEVIEAATRALRDYGTGACGSPLLSGKSNLHRELELQLAAFSGREDAMIFNSGFAGGMGTLTGLLRKGDVAILDAKSHLCSIDGAKLAKAKLMFFAHNDPDSLDEALQQTAGQRRLIVVEGVYSMDGDTADLPNLLPVAEKHGVGVLIDEAHSILCYGAHGRGVIEHYGVESRVALQFATFSKAFAGAGSFTVGPRKLLQYMRYYINPYGFSCALPPSVVAGVSKALEIATRDNSLRERLWANTRYFREQAVALGLNVGESTSQVVPIIIGSDRRRLYELTAEMHAKGLFLAPVDYPSVPEDGLRFRVAITAAHAREDLDLALQILEDTVVRTARQT
ncbi:MAG: aminotransferase class I/II-fold pyridoxal phosphate-dependent enzyme [Nannocystis sp.]|nr:aminotransferase class I/II-fold pyridoxal phosphate-dependent enzyme [Nannocystis sp.]MBA3549254.1 aminotransferase class I/II-fold pyridoxal phosphate-dependent enzyme [Nannocystis sp.]